MPNIAKILLPLPFDEAFDYAMPEGTEYEQNEFVCVPFGKKTLYGVIWKITEATETKYKLKPIISSVKELGFNEYKISDSLKKFIEKQAEYTLTPLGKVLSLCYSQNFFKPVREKKSKKADDSENYFVKTPSYDGVTQERVAVQGKNSSAESCRRMTASKSGFSHINLNNEQQEAYEKLLKDFASGKFSVTLLDGVTGSGKTEVYFKLTQEVLSRGKQVLIMLPEILLTTQIIKRFENIFNQKPVIWHSGIPLAQKKKYFRDIMDGSAGIIIGARSALHLPYKNLGLIVCDEEHDQSYKQEEQVIFNARDMAVLRASIENTQCLLVSATPSAETYYNATSGKYNHIKLHKRYSKIEMPDVEIIDMRLEKLNAKSFISSRLKAEIERNIEAKLQTLLFLNRRGYSPLLLCSKCGFRFESPDTSAWLVLHKNYAGEYYLECHHSGYRMKLPDKCPSCNEADSFRACGPGVQRLMEEAKMLFPNARIIEMSSDNITDAKKAEEVISQITNNEVDIIIGTQIIAKGHHFPGLKTVGVIDADLGLDFADLRAPEKTFQILHQVSGRAGRENIKGDVLLQTYLPEHPVMKALKTNDKEKFLAMELDERHKADLPPFTRLAAIIISSDNDIEAQNFSKEIVSHLAQVKEVSIYGPARAIFHKLRGSFRHRILLKSAKNFNIQNYINNSLQNVKIPKNIKIKFDIDPYSFS